MSEQILNQYAPDSVSAPGETLEELLEARGMSQAEFAERTGRPKKTINEIIKGKTAITPETAIQFERVLGVPASFWIARENNYREALARAKEVVQLRAQTRWLDEVPYRAMAKLGWIAECRDRTGQLEELLRFFGVASADSWKGLWNAAAPAFRRSPSFESQPASVAAWIRRGELEAARIVTAGYSADSFKTVLATLRSYTRSLDRNFANVIASECASAGVCVVFVPELPGTCLWGFTRWVSPTRPLIQLSLRYKKDDHLWFTFFHEAGHILLHGRRELFLEDELADKNNDSERKVREKEADQFARDWLISPSRYRVFCRLGAFSCAAANRFAFELGIAPGIVVGRLQHDGHLPRTHCNDLKRNVNFEGISNE
jgi:HTH-type transcriptional regulator / antitoxin HigA